MIRRLFARVLVMAAALCSHQQLAACPPDRFPTKPARGLVPLEFVVPFVRAIAERTIERNQSQVHAQ
jgi:hypothetical protein